MKRIPIQFLIAAAFLSGMLQCTQKQEQAPICGDGICAKGESCSTCAADCGQCGDPIQADRRIPWDPGVPGGIPNRTTICADVTKAPYLAKGDGQTDDTDAIQAVFNECASEQVVYLPQGTYHVTKPLVIPSSITVRGDGPGKTIIDAHGSGWTGALTFGSGSSPDYWQADTYATNVTGGLTKGSTTMTVESINEPMKVGNYLMVDQENDPDLVSIKSDEGQDCTYCSRENGNRAMGQYVEVTAVDQASKSLSFTPPLYWTYNPSLHPQVVPFPMGLKWAGVEDLTVRCNNTGYRTNFMMNGCAYCWLRDVEGDFTDGDQVDLLSSFRCEIRDSYFHDSFSKGPGQTDNDLLIADKTTASLIENNIVTRLHVGIMLNWGAAGNVIAYNYLSSFYDDRINNGQYQDADCEYPSLSNHGAHPMFNLFEGNVATKFDADAIHGGSSHGTLFRNWWAGSDRSCTPFSGRDANVTPVCHDLFQQARAVELTAFALYYNVVGNILGSPYFQTTHCFPYYESPGSGCQNIAAGIYMNTAPDAAGYETPYVFLLGHAGVSSSPLESRRPLETLLNQGNWDFVTQSQKWDPEIGQVTLPASLFRTCKPGWFGDLPWPPIDPGNDPSGIGSTVIPAGYRFAHGSEPPGVVGKACQ